MNFYKIVKRKGKKLVSFSGVKDVIEEMLFKEVFFAFFSSSQVTSTRLPNDMYYHSKIIQGSSIKQQNIL